MLFLDTKKDSSDDENDYEIPDGCPPPVPRHNRPPPVPEHSCNNLQSSSDDEESACPDYMDPELDLYRPPVPIPQGRRANSVRRGGYNTPADYIPNIDKLMHDKEDDEFLHNTQYVDPEKVFTNGPSIAIVSKKTENDEEMYTDGKKVTFYFLRTERACYNRLSAKQYQVKKYVKGIRKLEFALVNVFKINEKSGHLSTNIFVTGVS